MIMNKNINRCRGYAIDIFNWLSKFFRGFRQKFGGQLWGREKIKAKN